MSIRSQLDTHTHTYVHIRAGRSTCDVSALVLLRLAGRADVLRQKGWHFITSFLCVFVRFSVCSSLCSLLKSGTWWMICGWKLGLSYRNCNFSFLVCSAERRLWLFDGAVLSCRAAVTVGYEVKSWSSTLYYVESWHYIVWKRKDKVLFKRFSSLYFYI